MQTWNKKIKMENFIINDLETSSSDNETDSDSDNDTNDESDNETHNEYKMLKVKTVFQ